MLQSYLFLKISEQWIEILIYLLLNFIPIAIVYL